MVCMHALVYIDNTCRTNLLFQKKIPRHPVGDTCCMVSLLFCCSKRRPESDLSLRFPYFTSDFRAVRKFTCTERDENVLCLRSAFQNRYSGIQARSTPATHNLTTNKENRFASRTCGWSSHWGVPNQRVVTNGLLHA